MVDPLYRIGGPSGIQQPGSLPTQPQKPDGAGKFGEILDKQIQHQQDLKFSMHAQDRIRLRNIPMTVSQVERLKNGVNQVAEKGGKESLVLMDSSAFLVSIDNRTVITAIGGEQLRDNVFTNIDSAIII